MKMFVLSKLLQNFWFIYIKTLNNLGTNLKKTRPNHPITKKITNSTQEETTKNNVSVYDFMLTGFFLFE